MTLAAVNAPSPDDDYDMDTRQPSKDSKPNDGNGGNNDGSKNLYNYISPQEDGNIKVIGGSAPHLP